MRIVFAVIALLFTTVSIADELEKAYQKEFAYLVAEKKALEQRLAVLKSDHKKNLNKIVSEIDSLQSNYLNRQNQIDRLNQQIVEASRGADQVENDSLLLETTLLQAIESLSKSDQTVSESLPLQEQLQQAFEQANQLIEKDASIYTERGDFFDANGQALKGDIVHVGRIARFAISNVSAGALAPSGGGSLRIWDQASADSARALAEGKSLESIDVFLFDNLEKPIEKREDRGFEDDIEAGGLIGKVILAIGAAGVLLVVLRLVFLLLFSSDINKITRKVDEKVNSGDIEGALKYCKKRTSSASKVIAATLRNLKRDRDHIEDIISESLLHESARIDRFGTAILVIAAVSPLLGLLGTVTGMISTFDIITEFGTGDPKLLSSGISEALITTKFGLIVAIPLLLIGNILTGWATRIKNELEQAALRMINTHKA